MAKKIIAAEYTLETGSAIKNVNNLKTELRQITKELERTDSSSDSFKRLQARAGELRDRIGDIRQRINAMASDTPKLDLVRGGFEGITAGFTAFQGAVGLFGSGSQELDKQLLKVQSSMALLNGVQALANTLNKDSAFMTLLNANAQKVYAVAVGTTTGALKTFRTALLATGIGVIVAGIGALIANFDKLKAIISPTASKVDELAKKNELLKESSENNSKAFELEERRLKALGVAEDEILKKRVDNLKKQLEIQKTVVAQQMDVVDKMRKDESGNSKNAKKYGMFGALYNLMFGTSKEDVKEQSKLLNDQKFKVNELTVSILETEKQIEKINKDKAANKNKSTVDYLKEQSDIAIKRYYDMLDLNKKVIEANDQQKSIEERFNKTRVEVDQDFAEASKNAIIEGRRLENEEIYKLLEDRYQKEIEYYEKKAQLSQSEIDLQKEVTNNYLTQRGIESEFRKTTSEIDADYERVFNQMQVDGADATASAVYTVLRTQYEKEKQLNESRVNSQMFIYEKLTNMVGGLGNVLESVGKKNRKTAEVGLALQKAAGVAEVGISTTKEIGYIWSNAFATAMPDLGVTAKSIATAAAITAGAARGTSILSTTLNSVPSIGNSGSQPSINTTTPPVFNPQPLATFQVNGQNNSQIQAVRAYIVESDLQKGVMYAEKNRNRSRFGG